MSLGYDPKHPPVVDFSSYATKAWSKGSHLHKLKPIADSNGNRAERRAAKKAKKRK